MSKNATKRLSQKEFAAIFSKVPRLVVDAVIKTRAGIVFAKRGIEPWKGFWHLPGGTVRLNERLEDAVVRIMQEETGLMVKVGKSLGAIEYLYAKNGIHNHSVSIVFLVTPREGILRGSPQGREVHYFSRMPRHVIAEQKAFLRTLSFPRKQESYLTKM